MALDASLEARQIGVTTQYKDARSGAFKRLPQRLYLIASGETGVSFSTTKFVATSAADVGQRAGYRSQAYMMARQLLPKNGDGIGTVPLTVALLADAGGGSAPAVGDITPSGTATVSASYRVNVSEVLSSPFVVPVGAVNVTDVCRGIGEAVNGTLGMPVRASYTYGTVTVTGPTGGTGNGTVTALSAPGNPVPGVWTFTCVTATANGGTFSLTNPLGVVVDAAIVLTVGSGATTVVTRGGLQFTVTDGATDFGVGATFLITAPATKVTLTAGWHGTTGNDLDIRVDGPSPGVGVEFAYTQPVGGLIDPNPQGAIDQIGNSWETMILNGLRMTNSTALDLYRNWGEGRWDPTVKKPAIVFTGHKVTTPGSAISITDGRKTDRVNSQLVAPGSRNLPCVIAARQVARIVSLANNIPSHDYCLQRADGLVPGADGLQWNLLGRDQAVKGGSSTVEVMDNEVRISNVVTMYHPTGEDPPAYRHVVDLVRLQNITSAVDSIFSQPEWAGAALVPDDQPTTEPTAKKPKMAVAEIAALLDNLGLAAIISDPASSKKLITATIDSQNPKRLNVRAPIKLSGNTNIVDTVVEWSFFFGGAAAA